MKIFCFTLMFVTSLFFGYANAESFSLKTVDSPMELSLISGQTLTLMATGLNYGDSDMMKTSSFASKWTAVRVPEQATLFLLGSGLIGLSTTVRRKIKNS